jgi:hypothetical protein
MNTAEYLQHILRETSEDGDTSDAVEYAIYVGWLKLSYDLQTDKETIRKELPSIIERFSKFSD